MSEYANGVYVINLPMIYDGLLLVMLFGFAIIAIARLIWRMIPVVGG